MKSALPMLLVRLVFPALVALSGLASLQTSPSNTGGQVTFADDFQSDSRKQYKVQGPVQWEKGRFLLGPGATADRERPMGPVAQLSFRLEFPPLAKDGEVSETRIGFVVEGGDV